MLKVVLRKEDYINNFSKKKRKWELLDYASGNGINLFPFVSLPFTKILYLMRLIYDGENPFIFYDDVFSMALPEFEAKMISMGKNKFNGRFIKLNIDIPKSSIAAYEYNLNKHSRQKDLLGDKIKNRISLTNLEFAEFTIHESGYLLPIMKMTFVQPSAIRNIRLSDVQVSSALSVIQHENTFIISNINCKPIEIKNI